MSSHLQPPASSLQPLLVALATYNEIENLPSLVEAVHRELPNADVLIVDDNSPDGTGRWCDEYATGNPWFSCLHRAGKLGLGSALAAAMRLAIEQDYRLLLTLDADWSHPPSCLPQLVAAADQAEVVIGSRYCPGGAVAGWPWYRRVASQANNWLTRSVVGLPTSDSSGNFRAYQVRLLDQLDWNRLQASGYSFLEEILWHLSRLDARFAEVPITFTNRRAGVSKIGLREVGGKLTTLSRLAWRRLFSSA
jgi:dolichol-phosphate mannosyltransferase